MFQETRSPELGAVKFDEKKDWFTLINPMFLDVNVQLEGKGYHYFHNVMDWFDNMSRKD